VKPGPPDSFKDNWIMEVSDAIPPRWFTVSGVGLGIAAVAWFSGESILARVVDKGRWYFLPARITGAILSGFGEGFSLLFVLTLVSGGLYWLIGRRKGERAER
jgi:hypothetical protein